jgi:hypothetical protein
MGSTRTEAAAAPRWRDDAFLCYVVLEQARLACETLIERASTTAELVRLREAHFSIGLAGYVVSDGFEPELREALLEVVRRRPVPTPPAGDDMERVCILVLHARALSAGLVHRHARHALEPLARLLTAHRVNELDRATRAGRLEQAWQQRWLAPLLGPPAVR